MKVHTLSVLFFALILPPGIVNSAEPVVNIHDAWIREAPPNARSLAGYMTLKNPSNKDQVLLSASATEFGMVMIHKTEYKNGMAHMNHQKQVTIPARGKLKFAPGGYHLMLMNPKHSLRAGDETIINFVFADKSQLKVKFKLRKGKPMKCGGGMKH